jgi:hypothetical protein
MYIITVRRMISAEPLKQRNGFCIRRGYITHPEAYNVATAQLAIDGYIEERQVPLALGKLQPVLIAHTCFACSGGFHSARQDVSTLLDDLETFRSSMQIGTDDRGPEFVP